MAFYPCRKAALVDAIEQSAGAAAPIVTFNSQINGIPLAEFIANITPVQAGSGDPSPSNPRAINGVDSVVVHNNGSSINQWDEAWEVGGYDTTTGQKTTASSRIRNANYIAVTPNTEYYIYNGGYAYRLFYYDANRNFISSSAYDSTSHIRTMPSNCYFINFQSAGNYGSTYNNDISINYPATDTAYHAYTGQTATINLGGTYYGGYLNVQTGLLTVDSAMKIFDGDASENWKKHSTLSNWFYIDGEFQNAYSDDTASDFMISNLGVQSDYSHATQLTNGHFAYASNGRFIFKNTDCSTTEDFKTWLSNNNMQIVFTLATPQTVQLTPAQLTQLLGENNVWADSGDSSIKYYKLQRR